MNTILPSLIPHDNIPYKNELIELFNSLDYIHSVYIRSSIARQEFIKGLSDYDLIVLTNCRIYDSDYRNLYEKIDNVIDNISLDLTIKTYNYKFTPGMRLKLKTSCFCIYNIQNDITQNLETFTLKDFYDIYIKYNDFKLLSIMDKLNNIYKNSIYQDNIYFKDKLRREEIRYSKIYIQKLYIKYLLDIKLWLMSRKEMVEKLKLLNLTEGEVKLLNISENILTKYSE